MLIEASIALIASIISSLIIFFNTDSTKDLRTGLKPYFTYSFVRSSTKYFLRHRLRKILDIGETRHFKRGGKKYIEVTYFEREDEYKIVFEISKRDLKIDKITSASGQDITNRVLKYVGIDKNFHGTKITPSMLGESSITFHQNPPVTFTGDEIMRL